MCGALRKLFRALVQIFLARVKKMLSQALACQTLEALQAEKHFEAAPVSHEDGNDKAIAKI